MIIQQKTSKILGVFRSFDSHPKNPKPAVAGQFWKCDRAKWRCFNDRRSSSYDTCYDVSSAVY